MGAIQTQDISLEQAQAAVAAAIAKAGEINTKMDIAVVDAGGNGTLYGFARLTLHLAPEPGRALGLGAAVLALLALAGARRRAWRHP